MAFFGNCLAPRSETTWQAETKHRASIRRPRVVAPRLGTLQKPSRRISRIRRRAIINPQCVADAPALALPHNPHETSSSRPAGQMQYQPQEAELVVAVLIVWTATYAHTARGERLLSKLIVLPISTPESLNMVFRKPSCNRYRRNTG